MYVCMYYEIVHENAIELVIKTEEGNVDYAQPKELAKDRSNWRQWKWKPAHITAEYYRERQDIKKEQEKSDNKNRFD